nr:MAG: DNA terminal protein [Bacteriophage sp.]
MTKQDELLRKAVKNYNAKIKRLEKKAQITAEHISIPQKVYVSKIKNSSANIESIISELRAFTAKPKVTVDSELKKMVKAYNEKAKRFEKRGFKVDKLSYSKLKDSSDLQETKAFIREFMEGGYKTVKTEKGVELPDALYRKAKKQLDIINERRAKQRARLGEIERGNLAQMGRMRDVNLLPKQDINQISMRDMPSYLRSLDTQTQPNYLEKKNLQYVNNYISMLNNLFSKDDPRLAKIKDKILSMNIDDFIDASLGSDYLFILFYRDPVEQENQREIIYDKIMAL